MADRAYNVLERRPEAAPSGTGRRSLFGVAAALAFGSVPVATAVVLEPDAALIAIARKAGPLIEQHARLSDEWFSIPGSDSAEMHRISEAFDPLYDALQDMVEQADELTATTLAGFRAKALLLRWEFSVNNRCRDRHRFAGAAEERAFDLFNEMIAAGAA